MVFRLNLLQAEKREPAITKMETLTLIGIGIAVLLLLLGFTILALLYVSGVVSPIDVGAGAPPIGKAVVAYKFARGPYKYSGDLFNEVTKHAPDYKCLGIYYDDPKVIPEEKLRYAVGAILSEGEVKVEEGVVDRLKEAGFNIVVLPEVTNCVKTEFPYINTLSIIIAVWRVYPRLSSYIKEHKLCAYPFLEIYEGSAMYFMAPLAKQEEFFVPESKEDIPSEYEDESIFDQSEGSPSSSASRSMSRFTEGSFFVSDDQEESDLDESLHDDSPTVQDGEITSSVDVRASKARTNLLENHDDDSLDEDESRSRISSQASPVDTDIVKLSQASPVDMDKGKEDDIVNRLQDSGICSGRTSAVPSEVNMSQEGKNHMDGEMDADDSASSFEEIHME